MAAHGANMAYTFGDGSHTQDHFTASANAGKLNYEETGCQVFLTLLAER